MLRLYKFIHPHDSCEARAAAAAAAALAHCCAAAAAAPKPHIVYALIDDFGWANAGWHRATPDPATVTPNLDALVKEGVELDRFYGHKFCGPSRAALQSGRLPIHVTVLDNPLPSVNPKDPDGGFQGIPRTVFLATPGNENFRAALGTWAATLNLAAAPC